MKAKTYKHASIQMVDGVTEITVYDKFSDIRNYDLDYARIFENVKVVLDFNSLSFKGTEVHYSESSDIGRPCLLKGYGMTKEDSELYDETFVEKTVYLWFRLFIPIKYHFTEKEYIRTKETTDRSFITSTFKLNYK